ncbi:G-protein coupled receptor moody-like [Leucoraja erinacea]|uniref:G-protein coupled receptor moody-like n=1 Tax=Leucoraja erinaceus TaxID=7782 RepID=UPI00245395B9|nr:G-protein coupled receptor moody-like [Leucoraja erinacea]
MLGPLAIECNETDSQVYIPLHPVSLAVSALILSLTCVIGVLANGLACRLLRPDKSPRTPINALLLNLAATDLLKCAVDIPLLLAVSIWGNSRVDLGETACVLQPFAYSLSSCVQLATLVVISVERYQAIAHPFQVTKKKIRIQGWGPIIWSMSFMVSVLSVTLTKKTPAYVRCRHLSVDPQKYFDPFGTFILVPTWTISLALIVGHYLRIFALVRRHNKRIFDRGMVPSSPKERVLHLPGHGGQQQTAAKAVARGEDGCPPAELSPVHQTGKTSRAVQSQVVSTNGRASTSLQSEPPDAPNIMGAVCLISRSSRETAKKRMEGRLAKRFGYIMLTFLVCWMPLVTVLLLNMFVQHLVSGCGNFFTFGGQKE